VNLEKRLLHRLAGARHTIEFATYEINLPRVIQALIDKAAEGVKVRVIADAKAPDDEEHEIRYDFMRGFLERLIRGKDGEPGTSDDVLLFADSPVIALEDTAHRRALGLPDSPGDLPAFSGLVGTRTLEGRLVALGEEKAAGSYYSAPNQMHNKFAVVDGEWVFTGSWNFTLTGLYGDEADYLACGLNGSQQHSLEIRSAEVAAAYRGEFAEMWGGTGDLPDPAASDFHGRKSDDTPHLFQVGGRNVEVYFSPGDGAVERLAALVREGADSSAFFAIYAWSDQALVDELKLKWEGSKDSAAGTLTGFSIRGLFDASFWNQWWSASIEMTGRTHGTASVNNPGVPWRNPAPVCRQGPDSRKLHSKTMVIDADTDSDPTVVIGSTNWSNNGEDVNDENMVVIHDRRLANQVRQEFEARWEASKCAETP
jgi:phosphatidylserine/phosphatidylglycerophosphate/cardiolipin synthase-like enzyme